MTDRPDKHKRIIFFAFSAAAVIIGFLHAHGLTYVDDDCFVSFRYAKNFIHGLGLVYNAEERVEGYTNFLWTMLIAAGMKARIDPVHFSTSAGIFFYILTLVMYARFSYKLNGMNSKTLLIIPLTTLALSLHRDFNAHATSGLETSMFTFFISASYCMLVLGRSNRSVLSTGAIFVLAMMTRPDGVIFFACAVLFLILTRRNFVKPLALLTLPALLLFLPYWIWRYQYYGFFFPNTFYAKSIDLGYYSQGLRYFWLYFKTYPVLFLAPAAGVSMTWNFLRERTDKAKVLWNTFRTSPTRLHPYLLGWLYIIAYTLFIIRIGGDFMFARFFIPITPMLYVIIERYLNEHVRKSAFIYVCAAVLLFTYFRFNQYTDNVFVGYIADEESYFTKVEPLEQSQKDAATLKRYFRDMPVRVAFYAGQVRLIYYLDPPFAVESSSGLTDTAIAHQILVARERPGHEKHPTLDYLIKRHVNFYIGPTDPVPPGQFALNAIVFDSLRARIITYDNRIMSSLEKDTTVAFIPLPSYLDNYISRMSSYPRGKVAQDYLFLKSFYFDVNNDKPREAAFVNFLGSR